MNQKGFTTFDLDLTMLKAKSYIHETPFIEEEYNRRIEEFQKQYKKKEYITAYENLYGQIKKVSIAKAKLNNRTLKYMKPYTKESLYSPYNAEVFDNNNEQRFFIDFPEIYYYPSLSANFISLTKTISDVKDFEYLKIVPNLVSFYYSFCLDNTFLNSHVSITIPDNLSFYITLGNIKVNTPLADYMRLIFDACALCEVLSKLQNYVETQRLKEIFNNTPPKNIISHTNESALTPEEIEILRLRKNLSNNTFPDIGNSLNPKLTENNVKQKSIAIRNKLGAKTIDEAINIFETRYNKL